MVTVSISETYDLHTVVNKMTLIGIHSPPTNLIMKTYPGLCMNYKYFRIKSVDVVLSTAQTLPLSVGEIGLDANQIRPQDMMNPILYKAVSNDSWSTLEARLMGIKYAGGAVSGSMADVENDDVTTLSDEHNVYYALLSNREGFRVAHPQQGLSMKGLRPLLFQKLYSHGENNTSATDSANAIRYDSGNDRLAMYNDNPSVVRGHPVPFPRINTTYITGTNPPSGTSPNVNYQYNGMGNGSPTNFQFQMPSIPQVMLGCICIPPSTATTGILYYRMVTRCWIEFSHVRPITDITSFTEMGANNYAGEIYHSDYSSQSKSMDEITDMVDIKNGSIEKIMEGR